MLGLKEEIVKGIEELGFEQPTPVQEKVIPILLEKDIDLIALAQTGTGKTAAFGLPIIQKTDTNGKTLQNLILSPTRELCVQIARNLKDYAKYLPQLRIVELYGGTDIVRQIKELRRGAHIVVATPGRLHDLIRREEIDLSAVERVVLDEADEMLDMGFKEELNAILSSTPITRTTILFSATLSQEAEKISAEYMFEPTKITVGKRNSGNENVTHEYYAVHRDSRYAALKRVADMYPDMYGIVFCRTRMETKEVAAQLIKDGYNADALHGDLSQSQRDSVMDRFRYKNIQMLVATDVAARGLDVNNLTCVINYNLPDDTETYTHRSGRTGRAGQTGSSISLVTPRESSKIKQIERIIRAKVEKKEIPNAEAVCQKQIESFLDKMVTPVEESNEYVEQILPSMMDKFENLTKEELVKQIVNQKFQELFDYYKNAPDLNNVRMDRDRRDRGDRGDRRDRGDRGDRRDRGDRGERGGRGRDFVRLDRFSMNIGQDKGLSAGKVIELINKVSPGEQIKLGRIDVTDSKTYFDADQSYSQFLMDALNGYDYFNSQVRISKVKKPSRDERGGGDRRGGGNRGGDRRGGNRDFRGGNNRGDHRQRSGRRHN